MLEVAVTFICFDCGKAAKLEKSWFGIVHTVSHVCGKKVGEIVVTRDIYFMNDTFASIVALLKLMEILQIEFLCDSDNQFALGTKYYTTS